MTLDIMIFSIMTLSVPVLRAVMLSVMAPI
jgi:hypothetical protein